jgi:lipopolysaccharide export system permease protein
MRSLTFYLLRQMTVSAVMTASGLTFAIWLSQSLRLLDIIINRGLSTGLALEFLLLLLPSLFALLLPIAVFIAVMIVYLRMNSDSELVVIRNAGVSDLALARPAILFGLATTILTYGLTLYGIPASMRSYHDIQRESAGTMAGVLIEAGVFTDLTPGVTFFAHARDRSGGLSGIIVDDTRDKTRSLIYTAERGLISASPDGPRALLEKGTYQETDTKTGQVSVLYFDHTAVGLGGFFGGLTGPRLRTSDELYLGELWTGANAGNDLDARWRMRVEAHRRLVDPTYCLAFAMIAAGCLIAGGQPRQGHNLQVLMASGCAAVLMISAFMLRSASEGTDALAPAVYALPILAIALSFWPLTRNRPPGRANAPSSAR